MIIKKQLRIYWMHSYRRELDGLRALAVFAVIIYHARLVIAGTSIFTGGLFGVDVFLVLSGYLITGIIREKIDSHQFSLGNFYLRRFKRIVPVFLFILSVVSIAAFIILLPDELVTYARSLKSALYFGSNYFFYGEDSYTADASIYKPLLHTWSLAVECQFYLLYPLLIWLICRFFKPYLFSILLAGALLSFQYANFIVHDYPEKAFYLLPSRAWELLAGGLMTFFCRDKLVEASQRITGNYVVKAMPLLGLYLIGYSFIFVDDHAANPSFITLLPVLGTCLFILFAQKGELATDFFSLRPVVFIGLISYSLYLWHQPVFVFFRLFKGDQLRPEQTAILLVACIVFASISYKFIEKPFRYRTLAKWKLAFLTLFGGCALSFSIVSVKYHGYPLISANTMKATYKTYEILEYRKLQDKENPGININGDNTFLCGDRTVATACHFGDNSWILLGDSYAGQYECILKKMLKKKHRGLIVMTHLLCPFLPPSAWFVGIKKCPMINMERQKALDRLKGKKSIVMAARYDLLNAPEKTDGNKKISNPSVAWYSYACNIKKLLNKGHELYVIYPVPGINSDVKKRVLAQFRGFSKFRTQNTQNFSIKYTKDPSFFKRAVEESNILDSYLPDSPHLHKIRPIDAFCENGKCKVIDKEGGLYNGYHLSCLGAKKILEQLRPYI